MAWDVFYSRIDSPAFLGIWQVQKPALKISAVIKKAVVKTANLGRIECIVFAADDSPVAPIEDAEASGSRKERKETLDEENPLRDDDIDGPSKEES